LCICVPSCPNNISTNRLPIFLTAANQKRETTENFSTSAGKKLFKLTKKQQTQRGEGFFFFIFWGEMGEDTLSVLAFGLSILEQSGKLLVACLQNKLQLAKRAEIKKNADCYQQQSVAEKKKLL